MKKLGLIKFKVDPLGSPPIILSFYRLQLSKHLTLLKISLK